MARTPYNKTYQGELLPAVLRPGERTRLCQSLPRLGEAEGAVQDEGVDLHRRRLGQVGVRIGREPGVERVVCVDGAVREVVIARAI